MRRVLYPASAAHRIEDGSAGEVSLQQLTDRIASALDTAAANSSANSNGVPTLDMPFADPDMEALRQKVNDLIAGLRRT
ncbi:MAG: hypothetical protein ABI318_14895 [Chthoniobacteraceae bacterium]